MIYILLPIHNRIEITRQFISSLKAQSFQDYHLVLIDDGSSDGSAAMVCEQIPSATILQGSGNWWWGGSLQQGYLWMKQQTLTPKDGLLITNDDLILAPDFLEQGAALLQKFTKALIQAQGYTLEGELREQGLHLDWETMSYTQESDPEKVNCLSTRGLFLNAQDFVSLGGFYPRLLPHYASDYEFTLRAARLGYQLLCDSSLKLYADYQSTGIHDTSQVKNLSQFLKQSFSKRNAGNPWYTSVYVTLSFPWPWNILNVLRIWKGFFYYVAKHTLHRHNE